MNYNDYYQALELFLEKLGQVKDIISPGVEAAACELCKLLGICRIDIIVYENDGDLHDDTISLCLCDTGETPSGTFIEKKNHVPGCGYSIYKASVTAGKEELAQELRDKIFILFNTVAAFNSKNRLILLANQIKYVDSEVGIYNLSYYFRSVRKLSKKESLGDYFAVFYNMRRFSAVNEQIGRHNGTVVMRKFAEEINKVLDGDGVVSRVGGDNFILLGRKDKLSAVLDILKGTVINVEEIGERILVSAAAGVYVIPENEGGITPPDLMDRVSLAAHIAKAASKTDVVYFDDVLLEKSKHNMRITALFPKAIEKNEFLVYYQPKVDVKTLRLSGAEALCRWKHDGRLIPPIDFIPVIEQGRDICKLDFYMLEAVCRDIRRWLDTGVNAVRVSVNFSRRHLTDIDLLPHIVNIIDKYSVPHEYIEIELTETTTDAEFKDLKRIIHGLQLAGISTSVDDFGIGYSSLNLIKDIPWNVLKLDKSLLPSEETENSSQNTTMFRYIVSMAQEMGLECISEGVETKEQLALLNESGCELAQGFYFDRPLPVEEFEQRLINTNYTIT